MIKSAITKIHLWLGLISGIIVFIVSITGCIFVFSKEITDWRRKDAIHVEVKPSSVIPLDSLWQNVQAKLPSEQKINWANIYHDPGKSWRFYTYKGNPDAFSYWGAIDYYDSYYINPYNGNVKAVYDEKTDFFNVVKFIHWSLLLNTPIGQPIVGWSTFIFVILLISGLTLWWPMGKKRVRNSFLIIWKRSSGIYKKLYDLHNVLGFYSLLFALIIALTGMVWSFKWFQAAVYVIASGTVVPPDQGVEKSDPAVSKIINVYDAVYHQAKDKYEEAAAFRFSPPADSLDVIHVYVQEREGRYAVAHELQFDQYSGRLLKERRHSDKNLGEKLITANYDIHVGAIWGIPGKIIAFIISLICASLPVTGFLMWLKRTRKKRASLTI